MASNKGMAQVLCNIVWHSSEKVLRMLISFIVGIWLARYFGPEEFGQFNYIFAWLGMFNAFAWLGVGQTVVRDMVRDRVDEGRILGSALMIRLCGSLLAIVLAVGVARWFGSFDETQLKLLAILCIGVPFAEAPAGIWIWFASHINIGPAVLGKNASLIIGALLKVWVILSGAGLIALMSVLTIESVLFGLFLVGIYLWHGERFSHWRFDFSHAWKMLLTGLPIILSSLVVSLNARIDQIMLGRLTSMSDVGVYAAAMRFSEIWWMVPPVIVQTLATRYIYPKDLGENLQRNVARIIAGMTLLSLIPCFLISVMGSEVVSLFLGKQYLGAGSVLMIHIWTAVLVFIDSPVDQYLLATHRQSLLVFKSVVLFMINFGLAIVLVPKYGPQGAATAVLISLAGTVLVLPILYSPLHDLRNIYRLAVREVQFLPALCAEFISNSNRQWPRVDRGDTSQHDGFGQGMVQHSVLLLIPELAIWGMLVIGLLFGVLSDGLQLSKVTWIATILSAILLFSTLINIFWGKQRQIPSFMLIALLFLVYNIGVSIVQWHSLEEFVVGFNRCFQSFGIIMALVMIAFTPQSYIRWRKFLIVVALLQFPFALYELLVPQPLSAGASNIIAGTFGANLMRGGTNLIMVIYLFIVLSFLVARWRAGMINSKIFYPISFICVLPLGMGDINIVVFMLLLEGLILFRENLISAPLRYLYIILTLILLGMLLCYLYASYGMHSNPDEAIMIIWNNIKDQVYSEIQYFNPFTTIISWAEEQNFQYPLDLLIGHGLGSSYSAQNDFNYLYGHFGFKYLKHDINLTGISTLLWDTGLIGFMMFISIFISAWGDAGRLRRIVVDSAVKADALAIQAAISLFFLSMVYSNSIVNLLSMELIYALVLGYLGYLMNHHNLIDKQSSPELSIKPNSCHDMVVLTENKNY
ncbi:MAG: flippase [Methylobacter sp.]